MNKKKLSIFIYSLAGGGAERVVSILLHELKENYDITLVLMRDKIDYEIPQETKIHFIENSKPDENGILKLLKLPYLGWKYRTFCQKNKIEVSLAFMNRPSYISIFAKLFGHDTYTVISERTTPSMMYQQNNLLSKISKFLIKALYPKADFIISNAEGNRVDLIDNFAIDKHKVATIHNPFDLKKIEVLSKELVNDFQFNKFTFVSVGRLDLGKNHALMIRAFSKMEGKDSQLIILGEGILRATLENQIKVLDLSHRVFLAGFDNNPYKYFSKANVFLFTSNYEGFPNVLVEALACNLPVISSDCKSGPREILLPNADVSLQLKEGLEFSDYGILFPVNAEKELLEAMKIMMGDWKNNNMKTRAKDFDKRIIVNKFREILDKGVL